MSEERWLSTEDAARLIGGVTSRWIRTQIEAGRLRSRMLATGDRTTYRIRRDDLEAFVAAYILEDARDRTDRGQGGGAAAAPGGPGMGGPGRGAPTPL